MLIWLLFETIGVIEDVSQRSIPFPGVFRYKNSITRFDKQKTHFEKSTGFYYKT